MRFARPAARGAASAAALAVLAGVALSGCAAASHAAEPPPTASAGFLGDVATVGVLGDSMSLGVNACGHSGVCTRASWVMGTDGDVDSVADRIGSATGHAPKIVNGAVNGGSVATMLTTAPQVIAAKPQLVTVLIGANDACKPSFDQMTTAAQFQTDYAELIDQVATALPDAHILALSVPDLNRLWQLGHGVAPVAAAWNRAPNCRSLLGNAASTASADVERRTAVGKRVDDYDETIESVCAQHPNCIFDGDALHDHGFTSDEVSRVDFFHPSATGQAAIAKLAWAALTKAGG
ncbi:SGNH/GDSL hydrolase family protein [Gryllotalpicola protaetiae]|uniref:SGNH/GDSL hydrolase family protein n=1 Tax=Gryllotalpicola protaetiae TaxID=2419771 RepID=A0A387BRZ6_9MICO|nr:SGNH/GDSL hydrolase family protein [Gryllotalpicola protaetiae]AYG03707.1 SGNH/GDSL hydrolase family protein [Gryllotalpicola protaetiae]